MEFNIGDDSGVVWPFIIVAGLVLRTIRRLTVKLVSSFYRFLARFSGRRRRSGEAGVGGACQSAPSMPPPFATFVLVVSTALIGIAEACSSRSTPKPRPPSPTARPNITFHTYACPPAYATWYCLNGATCFTVKIGESLLYNCECSDGYMGQRCEFKDLEGSYLPSRQRVMLETASIAGGATIAVLLVVIVCVAAYIHYKRKQKEARVLCIDQADGLRDVERRPFSRYAIPTQMHHTPKSIECALSRDEVGASQPFGDGGGQPPSSPEATRRP